MKKINRFLLTTLIGGVVVILPVTLLILLAKFVFDFLRNITDPISQWINFGKITNDLIVDLLTLGMIIAFCFLVGLVVKTRFGKTIFHAIEMELLAKLPFYSTIKETVQQFAGTKKSPFSQVVLADVFSNGTRMIGFVSDEHADGRYTIFVPTGPNPTNGFIFMVDSDQLEMLDVRPDEAMRTIIAVGTGASSLFEEAE